MAMTGSGVKKRSRILIKTMLVTILAVILTAAMCGGSVYLYLEPILKDQYAEEGRGMVTKMCRQVAYYFDDVMSYARDVCFDDVVQGTLLNELPWGTFDYYSALRQMNERVNQYIMLRDKTVHGIIMLDKDDRPLETVSYAMSAHATLMRDDYYRSLIEDRRDNDFALPADIVFNSQNVSGKVLPYVRNIYNKQLPYGYLGKLIVLIDYDAVMEPLRIDKESGIAVGLYNQRLGLVYSSNEEPAFMDILNHPPESPAVYNSSYGRYFVESVQPQGWEAIGIISYDHINSGFRSIQYMLVATTLLCSLVMAVVVYFVYSRMTRPLDHLIRAMKSISVGYRDVHVDVESGDEVGELTSVFNNMVTDINRNTEELLLREKKEYDMTLQMLIYQINPHFVYNTLNCVIVLARRSEYEKIISLTRRFISLLRNILTTDPHTFAPLSEEIGHTNNYISILQFSYENPLRVEWTIESGLEDIPMPKLILYPLIENSIFHGILSSERDCTISVSFRRDTQRDNRVLVRVRDDGKGMDADTLELVRRRLRGGKTSEGHIGLVNVNNRLLLLFGPECSLSIDSAPDSGTTVSFSCIL